MASVDDKVGNTNEIRLGFLLKLGIVCYIIQSGKTNDITYIICRKVSRHVPTG